jgi:hypothetical protein
MSRKTLWACLAVVMLAAGAQAQTYTIKLKSHPDEGKSVVQTSTDRLVNSDKLIAADGKVLNEQKGTQVKETVFTETVLEKGDKGPKKFKLKYTKTTGKATALEGRTVVFEWKDGRYEASVEGKPNLPEKDLADVARKCSQVFEYDLSKLLLPDKPVKVGDTWSFGTASTLGGFVGQKDGVDKDETSGKAKLLRVYKNGDSQFGVIELDIRLVYKTFPELTLEKSLTLHIKGTLDTAIDGSSTAGKLNLTSTMRGKGTVERGGMKFTVELSNDRSLKEERSEEK